MIVSHLFLIICSTCKSRRALNFDYMIKLRGFIFFKIKLKHVRSARQLNELVLSLELHEMLKVPDTKPKF